VAGQDALLQIGGDLSGAAGILVASTSNSFTDVVPGLSLTLTGSSTDSVNIHVAQNDSPLVTAINVLVEQYNKTRDKLATYTVYNQTDKSTGPLFGSLEAVRIDSELSSLLSGRFFGVGDIQSLRQLGLDLTDGGKLTFDSARFQNQYAADPDAVSEFFTKAEVGFAARLDSLVETFAGVGDSLLLSRGRALQSRIENYSARVDAWNVRLDRSRELLLKKFLAMETAIGKFQNSLTAINSIQPIPSLISRDR
jgi:flagellar hook-associated protein 2